MRWGILTEPLIIVVLLTIRTDVLNSAKHVVGTDCGLHNLLLMYTHQNNNYNYYYMGN